MEEVMEVAVKPLTAAVTAGLIDYMAVSRRPLKPTLWYAGAVGLGVFAGDMLYREFMEKEPNAREIGSRTIQSATATGAGLLSDRLINGASYNLGSKTLTILFSEITGDIVANYAYPSNV